MEKLVRIYMWKVRIGTAKMWAGFQVNGTSCYRLKSEVLSSSNAKHINNLHEKVSENLHVKS